MRTGAMLLRRWADALMMVVALSMGMDVFALICSSGGVGTGMTWADVLSTVSETVFLLSVSGLVTAFGCCRGLSRGVRVCCGVTCVLLWCSVVLVRMPMLVDGDHSSLGGETLSYVSMFLSTLWLVSLFVLFGMVSVRYGVRGFRTSMVGMLSMLGFVLVGVLLLILSLLVADLGWWVYVAWTVVAVMSMMPFWCVRCLVYKFSNESNE